MVLTINLTYKDGLSKVCSKGCLHNGHPLHHAACKHINKAPSFIVSKLGNNKSIPLVESIDTGSSSIGIQYDLGSQISLISKSALQSLPPDMSTRGRTSQFNLLPFTGEGSTVLATEVTLKLNRFKLQLYAIEDELNKSSAFSIIMLNRLGTCIGNSQLSHSGRIDILLGGDNFHAFPKEKDRNSSGTALFKSEISYKYLTFVRPSSKIINWKDPGGNLTVNKFRANNTSTYVCRS